MRKSRLFGLSSSINQLESENLNNNEKLDIFDEKFISLYKDKFDEFVALEVNQQKKILESNFAVESAKQKAKFDALFNAEMEKQKVINERLEKIIFLAGEQLNEKLASEFFKLKEIAIALVLQSLYKISTKEVFKREIVEHVVEMLIEKMSSENLVSLSISAADHKLIESLDGYDKIKSFVHIDNSLSVGQMMLGDAGSFSKIGLADRLDSLRHAFIVALEQENEL